jgi:predicted CXXCH cytochrome family protein
VESIEDWPIAPVEMGLAVGFRDRHGVTWAIQPETGTASRSRPPQSQVEVDACARCHSRRATIHDEYRHDRPIFDTHRIAILDEALYHPDGQILDEVYVYGSFVQSRMYRAGVTCSDCHDPHSSRLHAPGNALCAPCHDSGRFDNPDHHFHKPDSPGALCTECHLPAKTYMVVDPRHDHSIRIPRPDLSLELGTPNACTAPCHPDRSNEWAAEWIAKWYGSDRRSEPHWGAAIQAGRNAGEGAEEKLGRLVSDPSIPAIARATAVSLLPRYAGRDTADVFEAGLRDPSPLVRTATLAGLEAVEPEGRLFLADPLLDDSVRTVRLEAGRVLASVPEVLLHPEQRARLEAVLEEYRAAQQMDADRPDAHLRLGNLHLLQHELDRAEREFNRARELAPTFVPTYVNLADLHRIQGREEEAERVLREALAVAPEDGDVHHALGLLLVRTRRLPEAIRELDRAAVFRPEIPRYSFVLAVALHSAGDAERAREVLQAAGRRHPADRDIQNFLRQLVPGSEH